VTSFDVLLTDDAVRDLEGLHHYISSHDTAVKADAILDRLEAAFGNLAQYPERGSFPRELLAIGVREYREIMVPPYRIIYRVIAQHVYIMVIADGRRNMQQLLEQRLLQS